MLLGYSPMINFAYSAVEISPGASIQSLRDRLGCWGDEGGSIGLLAAAFDPLWRFVCSIRPIVDALNVVSQVQALPELNSLDNHWNMAVPKPTNRLLARDH